MKKALSDNGFDYIIMDEKLTRFGAVETIAEGKLYAKFLKENRGKFDGVIISLANFGDENGVYYAIKDAGVPILVQAYPDELGKMDFQHRRDAVCGKLAICNVLRQAGIKYSLTKKYAVNPLSKDFAEDLRVFAGTCRIVKGLKQFTIGAIGARTTAFKTVRIDEIAMQNKRINVETIDLTMLFDLMDGFQGDVLEEKKNYLRTVASFGKFPDIKVENLARLSLALDKLIDNYGLDALALRCWNEFQEKYGIVPCMVMADFTEKGIPVSCELDVNNTIMMRALTLASNEPVMLLDVNNNYDEDIDKVILFHCGPAPVSMLEGKCCVGEHLLFKKTLGDGAGVGLLLGKVITSDVTLGSFKTENGKLWSFATEGDLTDDKFDENFFGVGTVFKKSIGSSNDMLNYMSTNGYRHHVAVAKGKWNISILDAFKNYLGYEIEII